VGGFGGWTELGVCLTAGVAGVAATTGVVDGFGDWAGLDVGVTIDTAGAGVGVGRGVAGTLGAAPDPTFEGSRKVRHLLTEG
jgi:hypothetical protein